MDNYIGPGQTVTFTAGAAITSGQIVVLPELVGIAANAYASGASGVLSIEGEFQYSKASGAIALGDLVDYDVSADNVSKGITPASGDVTNFAICTEAAASGDTLVKFKLIPGGGTFA